MKTEKRIIIVSNRLPIKIQETEIGYTYTATEGGLATGLGSVYKQNDNLWIGWPGNIVEEPGQERVTKELLEKNIYPVFWARRRSTIITKDFPMKHFGLYSIIFPAILLMIQFNGTTTARSTRSLLKLS